MIDFELIELDDLTHWGIVLRQPDAISYRIIVDNRECITFCNLSGLLELYRGVLNRESVQKSHIPELKWIDDDLFELTVRPKENELTGTCSREELKKEIEAFLADTFVNLDEISSPEQKEKAFERSENYGGNPAIKEIYGRIITH